MSEQTDIGLQMTMLCSRPGSAHLIGDAAEQLHALGFTGVRDAGSMYREIVGKFLDQHEVVFMPGIQKCAGALLGDVDEILHGDARLLAYRPDRWRNAACHAKQMSTNTAIERYGMVKYFDL